MAKIITIHQPDFMPWLGLFNKIKNADEWIVLDHVKNNPKSAEFWCRRVKMLIGGKDHWMSVTLKKNEQETFVPINQMEIQMDERSLTKFISSVELNYKRAPFFSETFYLIENYFKNFDNNLCKKNVWFIEEVMERTGIKTKVIYSSEIGSTYSSNEMLIDLLKKRGANEYLCGAGSAGYQNDELYIKEGIQIKYNSFQQPVYSQFNTKEFVKGLSIIDVLMNIGFKGVSGLLFTS